MCAALRFEWAWQHAYVAKATSEEMAKLATDEKRGTYGSVRRKLREMFLMLYLAPWIDEKLTISFTIEESHAVAKGLGKHYRCPESMVIDTRELNTFPGRTKKHRSKCEPCSGCFVCENSSPPVYCRCCSAVTKMVL
jgi:hypothetical protein